MRACRPRGPMTPKRKVHWAVDYFVILLLQIASAIASLVLLSIGLVVIFGMMRRQPGARRVPDARRLQWHSQYARSLAGQVNRATSLHRRTSSTSPRLC